MTLKPTFGDDEQPEYLLNKKCPHCGGDLALQITEPDDDAAFYALEDLVPGESYMVAIFCYCSSFRFESPLMAFNNSSGDETNLNPMLREDEDYG